MRLIEERTKYRNECLAALDELEAEAVVLVVVNGREGTGVSAVTRRLDVLEDLPNMLRILANDLENEPPPTAAEQETLTRSGFE